MCSPPCSARPLRLSPHRDGKNIGKHETGGMRIFRTFMGSRRSFLFVEHVGALNMIEIEFHKEPKTVQASRHATAFTN
jgi:hypothetical protein